MKTGRETSWIRQIKNERRKQQTGRRTDRATRKCRPNNLRATRGRAGQKKRKQKKPNTHTHTHTPNICVCVKVNSNKVERLLPAVRPRRLFSFRLERRRRLAGRRAIARPFVVVSTCLSAQQVDSTWNVTSLPGWYLIFIPWWIWNSTIESLKVQSSLKRSFELARFHMIIIIFSCHVIILFGFYSILITWEKFDSNRIFESQIKLSDPEWTYWSKKIIETVIKMNEIKQFYSKYLNCHYIRVQYRFKVVKSIELHLRKNQSSVNLKFDIVQEKLNLKNTSWLYQLVTKWWWTI